MVEEHEKVALYAAIFLKIENLCFNDVLGLATPLEESKISYPLQYGQSQNCKNTGKTAKVLCRFCAGAHIGFAYLLMFCQIITNLMQLQT